MKENELTITAAQRATRYSRMQVYNLIWQQKVESRKVGNQWFINRRSLEKYCAKSGRTVDLVASEA